MRGMNVHLGSRAEGPGSTGLYSTQEGSMEASQDNCTVFEAIASSPGLGVAVEIRLIGGAEVVLVGDRRRGLFSVEIGERESAWSGPW